MDLGLEDRARHDDFLRTSPTHLTSWAWLCSGLQKKKSQEMACCLGLSA
jgi:hypothetical protein